jgi:hypothetical protein
MIPETLHLMGFAGIRAGLGRNELSLDLGHNSQATRADGGRRSPAPARPR